MYYNAVESSHAIFIHFDVCYVKFMRLPIFTLDPMNIVHLEIYSLMWSGKCFQMIDTYIQPRSIQALKIASTKLNIDLGHKDTLFTGVIYSVLSCG